MLRLRVTDDVELAMPLDRHAEPLFQLIDSERHRLTRWVDVTAIRSVDDQRSILAADRQALASGKRYPFVIEVDNQVAGTLTLFIAPGRTHVAEIGYMLGQRFEGQGIVTRSITTVMDGAEADLGLRRFEIRCAVDNVRSRAVADRLEFVEEGVLRASAHVSGQDQDEVLYGRLGVR